MYSWYSITKDAGDDDNDNHSSSNNSGSSISRS